MKINLFKLGLFVGIAWSANLLAEESAPSVSPLAPPPQVSLSDVKAKLSDQQDKIEDECEDINIKRQGTKIKVGKRMTFNVDHDCTASSFNGGTTLLCEYNTAEDQALRLREVKLKIDFDAEGNFAKLEKAQNAGFLGGTTGGAPLVYSCGSK